MKFLICIVIVILHVCNNVSSSIINSQDLEAFQYDDGGRPSKGFIYDETCMQSIYNSVDYSSRYLDKNYYFIILNYGLSPSSNVKYTNNLRTYEYTPVTCGEKLFGVWIFTHGDFVIHSRYWNETIMYSSKYNSSITCNDNNVTLSFNYVKKTPSKGLSEYKNRPEFYSQLVSEDVRLDIGACVQSLYNHAQYVENIDNCISDPYCKKEQKFVIVLNLNRNPWDGLVYSYENNLVDYHYKSVECGRSIFGVWVFPYGQFIIQSNNNVAYSENSCIISQNDVQKYVLDFDGGLIYTLNQNTYSYIDNSGNIIINFFNATGLQNFIKYNYFNQKPCSLFFPVNQY